MNSIKQFIGRLTLKKYIKQGLYVDSLNHYWVIAANNSMVQPYTYQNIEQGKWGVWKKTELRLGLWKPLKEYMEIKQ